jgi:hypothetical protein
MLRKTSGFEGEDYFWLRAYLGVMKRIEGARIVHYSILNSKRF